MYDTLGTPHDVVFKFTRLPVGANANNIIQYSVTITVARGAVKRNDSSGTALDATCTPLIISFNEIAQLNLFDYGQPTESDIAPQLYVEWSDPQINSDPVMTKLNLGRGKEMSRTAWAGTPDSSAEGKITAYDRNSLTTYSHQNGFGAGSYKKVIVGRLMFATVPNLEGLEWMGTSYQVTEFSGFPMIAAGGLAGWRASGLGFRMV